MKICILSGKGGAGKTFVAVNLAYSIDNCLYIDCDVEEPNGALFLKPNINNTENVYVKVPKLLEDKCTGCRKCIEFCQFNALAFVNNKVIIFDELCHSCGGCNIICNYGAFDEVDRNIGKVQYGEVNNISFRDGILNKGEMSASPIINKLLCDTTKIDKPVIVDCPPGSSCSVIESIEGADFCVLVTEPTIFGVHNVDMVYNLTKLFNIPCALVINKAVPGNTIANKYCKDNNIPIALEIPYKKDIGLLASKGEIVSEKLPEYRQKFKELYNKIQDVIKNETISSSKR